MVKRLGTLGANRHHPFANHLFTFPHSQCQSETIAFRWGAASCQHCRARGTVNDQLQPTRFGEKPEAPKSGDVVAEGVATLSGQEGGIVNEFVTVRRLVPDPNEGRNQPFADGVFYGELLRPLTDAEVGRGGKAPRQRGGQGVADGVPTLLQRHGDGKEKGVPPLEAIEGWRISPKRLSLRRWARVRRHRQCGNCR